MATPPGTLLVISGPGIAPYSARGLTQTLELVDAASRIEQTVNGVSINLSPPQFRKFKSTITCTDWAAPAFDGLFPGDIVTVQCAKERTYKTVGGAPDRPVVAGSERVDGDYTHYRPELVMMVVSYTDSGEEYAASNSWQLDLVEVSATYP